MAIEIMIGLPHLREGPISNRARAMQASTLISANALSRWNRSKGWPASAPERISGMKAARPLAYMAKTSIPFCAMRCDASR
jgi:hypothetical protein